MVKYTFWQKIVVFVNSILAILLLLSYLLPYISPKTVPIFTIVSLAVPILFISNIFFVIYWIIKLKKQFTISLITIIMGFGYISSIYKFSEKEIFLNDDLKVMSYNVRSFNRFNWIDANDVPEKIENFINENISRICDANGFTHKTNLIFRGLPFHSFDSPFTKNCVKAIKDVTGIDARQDTGGGTSDARFLQRICPVFEFGTINKTLHKVDECVSIEDLKTTEKIYYKTLENFFS